MKQKWIIIIDILIIVVLVYFFFHNKDNSINWKPYSESEFEFTGNDNGIVIDFYADWCVPCKEMDKTTYKDKNVIEKLEKYRLLKADMTKSMSAEVDSLRNKFNIAAMPTVLIFNSKGKEIKRIEGYTSPGEFNKILDQLARN